MFQSLRRGTRQFFAELIGGPRRLLFRLQNRAPQLSPTADLTQPDYAFWDKARRGRAAGLELSGLFLRPLESKIAAWVLGEVPDIKCDDETTQQALIDWWTDIHSSVIRSMQESTGLGDSYAVVNADLSVTVKAPNLLKPVVDRNDYSRIVGWQITESFYDPAESTLETMTFEDTYTTRLRVRKIYKGGSFVREEKYTNLIGLNQVIHIPNNRTADEVFGRPEGDALIPALHAYGEIIEAAIDGNKRQGRPVPVISKLGTAADVQRFWKQYGRTEQQELPDGTVETTTVIDLDSDKVLTLGGEADFNWRQPGSFTGDTLNILNLIFYLIIQHTEVPEFIWGNAIQGSRASAETQLGPFVKWVEKKQGECRKWLLELLGVAVRLMALSNRQIKANAKITLNFAPLTQQDGTLTLEGVKLGLTAGLLDDETALRLMPLDVENPEEIIEKARAEREEKQAEAEELNLRRMEQQAALQQAAARVPGQPAGAGPQPVPPNARPAAPAAARKAG